MTAFIIFNIGFLVVILFGARGSFPDSLRPAFSCFVIGAALYTGAHALFAPDHDMTSRLVAFAGVMLFWATALVFILAFAWLRAREAPSRQRALRDFPRFEGLLLLVSMAPGLAGVLWSGFFPNGFAPLWALGATLGAAVALRFARPMYLLRQLQTDPGNRALLFEDRFADLVRGLRALQEVLVDRKIKAERVLILNAEENLSIERSSARTLDPTPASELDTDGLLERVPAGHLVGLLDNYRRMERHMSLMTFALRRYEQADLSKSVGDQGLRIDDPLLVLYHYLVDPEGTFRLSDALDVIEREDLRRLMRAEMIVRRAGARLQFTPAALQRARPRSADVPAASVSR